MSRSTIIPHPSHRFGSVAGERRCVRCWAAPTWDIIEQSCPTEGCDSVSHRVDRDTDAMPPWSDADAAEAYRMYMAGHPFDVIGARFGRTHYAAMNRVQVYRAQHGLPCRPRLQTRRVPRDRMDEIARMPGTLAEVARITGASKSSVGRARAALAEKLRKTAEAEKDGQHE